MQPRTKPAAAATAYRLSLRTPSATGSKKPWLQLAALVVTRMTIQPCALIQVKTALWILRNPECYPRMSIIQAAETANAIRVSRLLKKSLDGKV